MLFIQDIFLDKQAWWPKDVSCQNENQNNKKIQEKAGKIWKNSPLPPPPPTIKMSPCFHAFVIVPYTLYRNNSKKLRLLKGYHMNIILSMARVTSGRRSWPQERLLVKLSIERGRKCDMKTRLAFFVKGFPAYWDHSMLNPFVRKSTCFVYLQSSLFVQSSSSRQRRSLESNEDCLENIYGTYMYTKCACKVVRVE